MPIWIVVGEQQSKQEALQLCKEGGGEWRDVCTEPDSRSKRHRGKVQGEDGSSGREKGPGTQMGPVASLMGWGIPPALFDPAPDPQGPAPALCSPSLQLQPWLRASPG